MKGKEVKFIQIATGSWEGERGKNYSTIALGDDGVVYKYSVAQAKWVPFRQMFAVNTFVGED